MRKLERHYSALGTFCMVLLRRLRGAIDERLQEERAEFRSNRSCSEQIFCLRNVIEQCIEYRHALCVNFIDFKKAFDSRILMVYPQNQRCILTPVLFNIALDFVMRKAIKSGEAGISWNNHGRLTDLDYADDIALLAESDSRLREATSSFNREATKIGLRISAGKSKVMKIGIEHTPININVGTTHRRTLLSSPIWGV
ncbi:hypothetical protein ANCCEY_06794 [Ancylostoma ceylanicum]|uniref:Reverse transcriptase domain-containing protein n=1 Tax=Ancylostoma ceylanicum TaxID=53326 RepID=A0A0D6LSE7_9BILA|nr:hypothetical protein ANCCEY_06794 [Ancylostoma ceylanicum]